MKVTRQRAGFERAATEVPRFGVQQPAAALFNSMAEDGAAAFQGGSRLPHTGGTCRLPRMRPQV